jgi:trehalose-6-phosphate synthase
MKLSLRLILSLVASISVVTFVIASNQVRTEKNGLRTDLARRGQILTESLQETVEPVLPQRNAESQLRRIVDRFGDRERMAGLEVYSPDGSLLAASHNIERNAATPPVEFGEAKSLDRGVGDFRTIGGTAMYVYALPLHRDSALSGVLITFHNASYIEAQSSQIWRDALWHVIAQILLVVLITLLVVRSTIVGPIVKLSQWMKDVRTGKAGPHPQPPPADFLGPLTTEAASLGQSLAEARTTATHEAQLRDTGDSLWTAERLRAGIRRRLHGSSLFVVSNREPYHHVYNAKGAIEVQVPASGLVTALEPILNACDGTWIAHGSAAADRETVDEHDRLRVPPEHPHYTLRRVWLTKEEENGYYFGFSNEGIWPLCHIAHTRPSFRAADWDYYRSVNEKFAAATLQELEGVEKPFVLIQDYHFALLPRLIKTARPDARVAIFWHIPWPNAEAFQICPWQHELLDGLLGADLVGFHIQAHCNNFLETVDHSIECRIEWDRFTVNRNNHITMVRPHPISVVFPEGTAETLESHGYVPSRGEILPALGPETIFLGVGVDRVDYTKGIVERFRGIECFLDKYPQYRKKFTFVQFGAPSRTNIKRYQDFLTEVSDEAQRINDRFQSDRWKPIIFHGRHHSHREIEPYYKAADLCLVTSLHDGMNLVAKEFVAARDDADGVLILSQFTGACHELRDALLVNPYDTQQIAEMIRRALEMPQEERNLRMRQMRRTVKEHNVYRWAADLISELADIRLDAPELTETR